LIAPVILPSYFIPGRARRNVSHRTLAVALSKSGRSALRIAKPARIYSLASVSNRGSLLHQFPVRSKRIRGIISRRGTFGRFRPIVVKESVLRIARLKYARGVTTLAKLSSVSRSRVHAGAIPRDANCRQPGQTRGPRALSRHPLSPPVAVYLAAPANQ